MTVKIPNSSDCVRKSSMSYICQSKKRMPLAPLDNVQLCIPASHCREHSDLKCAHFFDSLPSAADCEAKMTILWLGLQPNYLAITFLAKNKIQPTPPFDSTYQSPFISAIIREGDHMCGESSIFESEENRHQPLTCVVCLKSSEQLSWLCMK